MLTPFLYDDYTSYTPRTEGIKYIGSKLKLLPHILEMISGTGARVILDGFSGSTRVSQALAKLGYRVICNDVSVWSEVFGICYLLNRSPRDTYRPLIQELRDAPPREGWFTHHYGGDSNGGRSVQKDGSKRPWQIHNTMKLDGIRDKIDQMDMPPVEKAVALTSLILALDKVDNTLGHYVSYLREWAPRSYKSLQLEVPRLFQNDSQHVVTRKDIFDVANECADMAYYDPPYGSNNEKMPPLASGMHPTTTLGRPFA